jgi:hypothetical protein
MFPVEYFAEMGNCFQLKAEFCTFPVVGCFSVPKDGKREADADCCAGPASVFVHEMFKREGSFIPLHL